MSNRACWLSIGLLAGLLTLMLSWPVWAEGQSWYAQQRLNNETQARLAVSWKSCCENSEVVRPRFRVNRTTYEDEWYWLDGNTWRRIPSDTIHYNETPDGKPLMFVYQGAITCFYPGDTGG